MRKLSVSGMKALAQLTRSDIIVMLELIELAYTVPVTHEPLVHTTLHKTMIGMNKNTINTSIKNLHKANLLIREAHGVYAISERLFN